MENGAWEVRVSAGQRARGSRQQSSKVLDEHSLATSPFYMNESARRQRRGSIKSAENESARWQRRDSIKRKRPTATPRFDQVRRDVTIRTFRSERKQTLFYGIFSARTTVGAPAGSQPAYVQERSSIGQASMPLPNMGRACGLSRHKEPLFIGAQRMVLHCTRYRCHVPAWRGEDGGARARLCCGWMYASKLLMRSAKRTLRQDNERHQGTADSETTRERSA